MLSNYLRNSTLCFLATTASLPIVTLGLSFPYLPADSYRHRSSRWRAEGFSLGLLDYLSYLLAFWTFNAGPIQRFEPFCEEFHGLAIDATRASWPTMSSSD